MQSDEIVRLMRCTESPRDKALLWLCLGAGLRVGEAATLQRQDVGSDGSLLVQASNAKSGKSRRVFLAEPARRPLAAWLGERGAAPGPLFPGRDGILGGALNTNFATQLVGQLLRGAGLRGATSHSLRRSHANVLRRSGADLTVIQGQLGHASLSTTAAYMATTNVERAAAVARLKF